MSGYCDAILSASVMCTWQWSSWFIYSLIYRLAVWHLTHVQSFATRDWNMWSSEAALMPSNHTKKVHPDTACRRSNSLKISNSHTDYTSVKVRWFPPKILMDLLIGCCYAAVALECSAQAYLIVDFWSDYDPMNMLFCNTHPDSSCNRWTTQKYR